MPSPGAAFIALGVLAARLSGIALPGRRRSEGERAEGRAPSGMAPPRYGLKGKPPPPDPVVAYPPA